MSIGQFIRISSFIYQPARLPSHSRTLRSIARAFYFSLSKLYACYQEIDHSRIERQYASRRGLPEQLNLLGDRPRRGLSQGATGVAKAEQIGRASCRERVCQYV